MAYQENPSLSDLEDRGKLKWVLSPEGESVLESLRTADRIWRTIDIDDMIEMLSSNSNICRCNEIRPKLRAATAKLKSISALIHACESSLPPETRDRDSLGYDIPASLKVPKVE
jgi:hypothetical protein